MIQTHPIVSDQIEVNELELLLTELDKVLQKNIPGDIVEFGCYVGSTSLFLQRLLLRKNANKHLHVYDSFEGLPKKSSPDESPIGTQFRDGELLATKSQFIRNFKKAQLPLPAIHKQWFEKLTDDDIPLHIAFAFLDGDYYSSIKTTLQLINDKLSPGSVVIVDDYQNEALPGAAKAVDEWIANRKDVNMRVQASLAILYSGP